jgi:hypothetical protein
MCAPMWRQRALMLSSIQTSPETIANSNKCVAVMVVPAESESNWNSPPSIWRLTQAFVYVSNESIWIDGISLNAPQAPYL